MTFVVCSKRLEEKMASISFSGSHVAKFGFSSGCKVAVDISKGQIIIRLVEFVDSDAENIDVDYVERG